MILALNTDQNNRLHLPLYQTPRNNQRWEEEKQIFFTTYWLAGVQCPSDQLS